MFLVFNTMMFKLAVTLTCLCTSSLISVGSADAGKTELEVVEFGNCKAVGKECRLEI